MQKFDPSIHHRRSIRLKGYDYSQEGLYFVTICVQDRDCIFGDVVDGKMMLNDEHIIRDYNDYARIDEYILNNPAKWESDKFYNE